MHWAFKISSIKEYVTIGFRKSPLKRRVRIQKMIRMTISKQVNTSASSSGIDRKLSFRWFPTAIWEFVAISRMTKQWKVRVFSYIILTLKAYFAWSHRCDKPQSPFLLTLVELIDLSVDFGELTLHFSFLITGRPSILKIEQFRG